MVIEVNKDVDRYQESVALGLSAKQLIFSAASLIVDQGLSYYCIHISELQEVRMWQYQW